VRHLSASWWKRAAAAADLVAEDDLRARTRALLAELGKPALAQRLGITQFHLTLLLRGRGQLTDAIAARLGYRRVVRYERIS
jgi:hypothetical protein